MRSEINVISPPVLRSSVSLCGTRFTPLYPWGVPPAAVRCPPLRLKHASLGRNTAAPAPAARLSISPIRSAPAGVVVQQAHLPADPGRWRTVAAPSPSRATVRVLGAASGGPVTRARRTSPIRDLFPEVIVQG